jgi:hypothetical protein
MRIELDKWWFDGWELPSLLACAEAARVRGLIAVGNGSENSEHICEIVQTSDALAQQKTSLPFSLISELNPAEFACGWLLPERPWWQTAI